MPRRQPVPRLWLMTDERIGGELWRAVRRLPRGAGIVFRHHATGLPERRRIFARIRAIARRRGVIVLRAGDDRLAGEDGVHGNARLRHGDLRSWPAHSRAEAVAGKRARADALFISPVYPTRTHPGAPGLGPARARQIMRGLNIPAIALGGVDAKRFAGLKRLGFYGWAAIGAWQTTRPSGQKRKAVPI